ncbi:AbrB/MazE/SpoVT family DNA-binding domain-containing protein [Sphingobium fuliginis]|nr:AbrB/MazE/SpoVT family DNA-binding domain-containing protein [Sphingobium fuliginis]
MMAAGITLQNRPTLCRHSSAHICSSGADRPLLATDYSHCYLTSVLLTEAAMGIQERITTTLSTKGQVILPKAIREQKHWTAGTKLIVEETDEGVLLKAAPVFAATDIESVFGSLRSTKPALSIDEMNMVISEEAKRRARD